MRKNYKVSDMDAIGYWCPGETLDDVSLKKLHNDLLAVNENSNANIKHKMLEQGTGIEDLKKMFSKVVISEYLIDGKPVAFLLSPLLENSGEPILHSGLMIVSKNPGANLMTFLFVITATMLYEKSGPFFVTNITSTPSGIENFSELMSNVWPSPDKNLRKPPRGYDKILQKLKSDYVDINFPDTEMINIDYKRFVMTSNSSGMGFKTNFHKVSRASKFKYNLFCHTWINYENEEDVIQVGKFNFLTYMKSKFLLMKLKYDLAHTSRKRAEENTQNLDVGTMEKKAS